MNKHFKQGILLIALIGTFTGSFYSYLWLVLNNNLFNWNPDNDISSILTYLAPLVLSYITFRISLVLNKYLHAFTLAYLIYSGWVIYDIFTHEVLYSGFFYRKQYSPFWFKLVCSFLLLLPVIGAGVGIVFKAKKTKKATSN